MKRIGVVMLIYVLVACGNKDDVNKLNFLKRGNQAYQENKFATAVRYYNEALAVDSAFVDALNNRGLAEMAQGLNDEAIFSFNTALQIKPDYAEAQLNYIKANLAVGQFYASLDGLEELEKIWPDTSIIYFTRGLVYHDMADDLKALENFKQAQELDPGNVEVIINIANIHYHNKDYALAIDLLKSAIASDAGKAQSYNVLAMCYAGQNDFERAAEVIATAVSLERNDPYILNNSGYIAFKQGDQAAAEKQFIQSMKRDPYNGWVYRNLGLLRLEQGNLEEAERLLARAYSIDPTIENLLDTYLKLLIAVENYPRACAILAEQPALREQYPALPARCN